MALLDFLASMSPIIILCFFFAKKFQYFVLTLNSQQFVTDLYSNFSATPFCKTVNETKQQQKCTVCRSQLQS